MINMVKRDWYDKLTLIISIFTMFVLIVGLFVVNDFNINLKNLKAESLSSENITVNKIVVTNEAGNKSFCIYYDSTLQAMVSGTCP